LPPEAHIQRTGRWRYIISLAFQPHSPSIALTGFYKAFILPGKALSHQDNQQAMIRGTHCMPTAQVRYGRPKGTSLDDRQQLQSIAALLAADPKLKPTTAIRALGVVDPSTVRRLRDKFRLDQARLMAEARRFGNENTPRAHHALPVEAVPAEKRSPAASTMSSAAVFTSWLDLSFAALSAAVEAQSVATQYWLAQPHVVAATRGQLTVNAVLVAVYSRSKSRPRKLH
jgi:hypothetical protein